MKITNKLLKKDGILHSAITIDGVDGLNMTGSGMSIAYILYSEGEKWVVYVGNALALDAEILDNRKTVLSKRYLSNLFEFSDSIWKKYDRLL